MGFNFDICGDIVQGRRKESLLFLLLIFRLMQWWSKYDALIFYILGRVEDRRGQRVMV